MSALWLGLRLAESGCGWGGAALVQGEIGVGSETVVAYQLASFVRLSKTWGQIR